MFIFTSQLHYQASPSPRLSNPSSINRLISTGVKLLLSLLVIHSLFYNWMSRHSSPFSCESGFISYCVCTGSITPDFTEARIGPFLIKQPSGGFLIGLIIVASHCCSISALMSECICRCTCILYMDACTDVFFYGQTCPLCCCSGLLYLLKNPRTVKSHLNCH